MADSTADDNIATLKHLISKHEDVLPSLRMYDAYYEGQQPMQYMHPDLWADVSDRIKPVIVNWPRLVVDSIEERLDVEGFRYADADKSDEELTRVWQANNLDESSQQGHVDALALERAFSVVGTNPDDAQTPLITIESPLEMHAELDPRTRTLIRAVKRWKSDPVAGKPVDMATLYLPNSTGHYQAKGSSWELTEAPDDHGLGALPVSLLANRPRLQNLLGISELTDVVPLSDAACKLATDMMVAAEFAAIPQRYVFGMGPEDFVDPQTGQPLSTWQAVLGRVWASRATDGKAGTFPAADLDNFHSSLNSLAQIVSAMAALPPSALGFTSDNPASADAMRAAEARLVKRVERRQRTFGGGWENTMRLVRRFQTGEWDEQAKRLETVWRNPATPTVAQQADAAVKLFAQNIVPWRQTVEDMGYSDGQIARMQAQRVADAAPAVPEQPAAPIPA